MEKVKLEIIYVDIKELKPVDYNPRNITEKEYEDIEKSLKEYDFVEPILVNSAENRKNIIIGGHQRVRVAEDLGFTEIPVVYKNIPDEKSEKKLNLRLNKNLGHWDWNKLAQIEEDLLKEVGFEDWELKKFVVNVDESLPDLVRDGEEKKHQMNLMFTPEQLEEVNRAIGSTGEGDNASGIYEICKKFNNT